MPQGISWSDLSVRLPNLLVATVVIAVLAPWTTAEQESTGEISGKVTDLSGGGIPGVEVTIRGHAPAVDKYIYTKGDGTFSAAQLSPQSYVVRFSFQDFKTVIRPGVVVGAGSRAPLIVKMDTGADWDLDRRDADTQFVRISTSLGDIYLGIYRGWAPITAANFLKYVDAGSYDGGRFYRVTRPDNYTPALPDRPPMEIIQGGLDPSQTSKRFAPIPLETTNKTKLKHLVGTLSMARGTRDSATSEFFILLDDQPSLDFGGKRFPDGQGGATFGRLVTGLEVVRAIQQQAVQGQNLISPVVMRSVTRVASIPRQPQP